LFTRSGIPEGMLICDLPPSGILLVTGRKTPTSLLFAFMFKWFHDCRAEEERLFRASIFGGGIVLTPVARRSDVGGIDRQRNGVVLCRRQTTSHAWFEMKEAASWRPQFI